MKKKFVSMLLTLGLILVMLAPTAFASGVDNYIVIYDGVSESSFDASEARSGVGWSWDGDGTLSLNGFHGAYIGLYVDNAVIDLAPDSDNSVTLDKTVSFDRDTYIRLDRSRDRMSPNYSYYSYYGVLSLWQTEGSSDLTIQGSGSLYVEGGADVSGNLSVKGGALRFDGAEFTYYWTNNGEFNTESCPLYVEGDFNISGGSVSVTAPTPGQFGYQYMSNYALDIIGNCTVTGGELSCVISKSDISNYYEGIKINGNYTQTGGSVKITSGNEDWYFNCFFDCGGDAVIDGGVMRLEASSFKSNSLKLGDGVTAVGGESKWEQYTLIVQNGTLKCPYEDEHYKVEYDEDEYYEGELLDEDEFISPEYERFPVSYVLIYGAEAPTPVKTVGGFVDVAEDAYYADPVLWAVGHDITNGTSDTTFSPDSTCTRGQIITFLYRTAGSPSVSSSITVSDAGDTYYTDAVLWAAENKMFSGSAFSPETPCTRSMVVDFMWKYAGSPTTDADTPFTDVTANDALAVAWAVKNGVTNGTSETTFSPEATCTRAQIVTFLYRAFTD